MIEQVRRFNRTVTQRIGALNDAFLSRGRPLGQARLLWEIGPDGSDVRLLRSRLDLDSGYLSRLLRSLENDGLVVPSSRAGPTGGCARRGSPAAGWPSGRSSTGAPMTRPPRSCSRSARASAPGSSRRWPRSSGCWRLRRSRSPRADPRHPDARFCLRSYFSELSRRFDGGFDPARSISADDDELTPPAGLLLVATLHGEPVGCGALKFHDGAPAEIKRMWVAPAARGLGLGRRLLTELEAQAAAHGAGTVRLETNRTLGEAIGLYRSAGYREVAAFNDEPYAHHWFEKTL